MEAVHAKIERAAEVCREICDRTNGYICQESTAAEDAFGVIVDEQWEIGERIFAIPAHTPAGMAVKLRAADWLLLEDYEDENRTFASIVKDIRRLAGEAVSWL